MSTAQAPRPARAHVVILHRQRLAAQALAAALEGLSDQLSFEVTEDLSTVLLGMGQYDVIVAEQCLVPSGLGWRRAGSHERAPRYIALGDSHDGPAEEAALSALRDGAAGWVPPTASPGALLTAVLGVLDSQVCVPPAILGDVMRQLLAAESEQSQAHELTVRERTVLELIALGHSTREIAGLLFLSPNTVRTHRQRLYRKLGVHTALEAVAGLHGPTSRSVIHSSADDVRHGAHLPSSVCRIGRPDARS